MGVAVEFLLNLLVVALLGITIAYCRTLNRRIRLLQDSRSELAELLRHFDESTTRASESIVALQAASKKIGETIQTRIEKANYVADDLAFLIERAGRQTHMDDASQPAAARVTQDSAKKEEDKPLASLQHMLDKLASRVSDPALRGARPGTSAASSARAAQSAPRSRAEQELLDVIKGSKV